MKSLKLSIVTSYFNSEIFIDQQASSILSQTYDNWEWIICDDFSTDGTKEKLIKLSILDNRIKLIEPKYKKEVWWNPQTYATGDIVVPIDGDDKILPGTFEKIVYYFNKFPEVSLLHFNANKYNDNLPNTPEDILNGFYDNVYISRDNISFLDAFERLCPSRSGIFGYLRIFRNLPGLHFKVHEDGDSCSSNDGQWLLYLEERGKSLAIPRTTYLARQHAGSENFRNWNIRGEANLISEAQERRNNLDLEMPRILDYFNDIYVAAESTYLSRLNWESESKKICFFNYGYSEKQQNKLRELFFEHEIFFDSDAKIFDYSFINIKQNSTSEIILNIIEKGSGYINLFCSNVHLHHNNRTGKNTLEEIKNDLSKKFQFYWNIQENRSIIYIVNKLEKNMLENKGMKEILLEAYENSELIHKNKRVAENEFFINFVVFKKH